MNKAYNAINWKNEPSTSTAINETNLNKMDRAIDTIDDRVIDLDNGKVNKEEGKSLVSNTEIAKIKTNENAIQTHTLDKSNPHSVTKAQVGLGNVDNTSDVNKPISIAQQEEFDAINSNLDNLETSDIAGGKNLWSIGDIKANGSDTNKVLISSIFKSNTQYTIKLKTKSFTTSDIGHFEFIYTDGTETIISWNKTIGGTSAKTSDYGKTIDIIQWKGWNYGEYAEFIEIQLEEGTHATDYEPYIPSVKMLAEEVSAQNESLSAQIGNGINDVLWVEDKYINSNGVIGDASGFHYSDLIPITKTNYTYYHYSTVNTGASTRIIGYDKSGNFKSLIKEYSNTSIGFVNTTFDIPNDVYFIRISEFSNFHDRKLAPAENLQTQVTQIKNDLSEKLKVISVSLENVIVKAQSIATVELPQEYQDAGYIIASILTASEYSEQPYEISGNSIQIKNKDRSDMAFAPTATVKVLIAKIG